MDYKSYIEDLKAQYVGKRVIFDGNIHTVVDVDYNGGLLIDKPAAFTDTTAISVHSAVLVQDVIDAKAKISNEFIDRYHTWLKDYDELSDHDYGWKYGWTKSKSMPVAKDCMKSVMMFQKYIFSGRWLPDWEKAGFDRKVIWQLYRDKFLSNTEYSNSHARATGHTSWYFISQATAKAIYKERGTQK